MGKYFLFFICLIGPILLAGQEHNIGSFKADTISWWKLDKGQDSLAAISWNKGINHLHQNNNQPKKQITIAVLDTDFDLNHRMLSKLILLNKDEVEGNNIDDDKNGYVDDNFGWNFLGIKNKDSALAYVLMEETRILRKVDSASFKSFKKKNNVPFEYVDVKSSFDSTVVELENRLNPYKEVKINYTYVMDTLSKVIPGEISITSLSNFTVPNDTIMGYVNFAKYYYENDFPYNEFISYLKNFELSLDICMNIDYDNRSLIHDKSNKLRHRSYGNSFFGKNISLLSHGSSVSGVIAHGILDSTETKNEQSIKNYPVKIMPLTFTGIGDFTDKDFYLGFKYAVDNGANIINISQAKTFSINPKVLLKAFNLAEKKNVLVVVSAGNQAMNLDKNWKFPQSIPKLYKKVFSNVLIVGASAKKLNENLLDEDSNYGLASVDIFAPGVDIPTILPYNKFTTKSGTSFAAPIATNVAALVWSHFPRLKASQIKKIIMDSGANYNGLVKVPCDDKDDSNCKNTPIKQPFVTLSKSGKIINAMNALTIAEKISPN